METDREHYGHNVAWLVSFVMTLGANFLVNEDKYLLEEISYYFYHNLLHVVSWTQMESKFS